MTKQEVIDVIFKGDPSVKYELQEFQGLDKTVPEMLDIFEVSGTGKNAGKKIWNIKSLCKFHSGANIHQVYVEGGKANPEEIVRQLWIWKLINVYGYSADQIVCECPVQFGGNVATKFADICVYHKNDLSTVKILFEIKQPKRKDGIEQLKSYLGAKNNPIGVWSNGCSDKVILYKPQDKEFDTLSDIPKKDQEPKDVFEIRLTLDQLKKDFNFKRIIENLEELVLADSGKDEFNEIFKLIFAKIYDEKEAEENKKRNRTLDFQKFEDANLSYERINSLFHKAREKWPGVFEDKDSDISLTKNHLQVCIGDLVGVRLLGSNLRIMDDAFEYLIPTEAKKKKGQFFTPRHVIEMCVRMLNPKQDEYVLDPSCGSAGFLLHAMEWAYPAENVQEQELRKSRYAAQYLWGIDFEARAAKTSRALMLIAGDGHTNIFGPDVSSLDPKTWYTTQSGKKLMMELASKKLTTAKIPSNETFDDDEKAWNYFSHFNFDIVLANPPFAGELKDKKMLAHYELAKPALNRAKSGQAKEERDVLFIERIINSLKPGGRAAIVLPQGKFNNSSLSFIRDFILHKARLLAVVGLHGNTFKPHTGTKTSVLVIHKYTMDELAEIEAIKQEVMNSCPDYKQVIKDILDNNADQLDIDESIVPEDIMTVHNERFHISEDEDDDIKDDGDDVSLEERISDLEDKIEQLKSTKINLNSELQEMQTAEEVMKEKQAKELEIAKSDESTDNEALKKMKEDQKKTLKELQASNKERTKAIKKEIGTIETEIIINECNLKTLTLKGRLAIMMDDEYVIERLADRYIDSQLSIRLDYPVFMAVSTRGGKDNSGDYEYLHDEDGNIVEDCFGNPTIDQDLVNRAYTKDEIVEKAVAYRDTMAKNGKAVDGVFYSDDECCIAEAFIKFAIDNKFDFWMED